MREGGGGEGIDADSGGGGELSDDAPVSMLLPVVAADGGDGSDGGDGGDGSEGDEGDGVAVETDNVGAGGADAWPRK